MGMWGYAAWDNDDAADWFGDLFQATKLAERVEKALRRKDAEEDFGVIRAAAHVLAVLGVNYVWPVERLEADLDLAIGRLEELKSLEEFDGDTEFQAAVDGDLNVLRARREALNPAS